MTHLRDHPSLENLFKPHRQNLGNFDTLLQCKHFYQNSKVSKRLDASIKDAPVQKIQNLVTGVGRTAWLVKCLHSLEDLELI